MISTRCRRMGDRSWGAVAVVPKMALGCRRVLPFSDPQWPNPRRAGCMPSGRSFRESPNGFGRQGSAAHFPAQLRGVAGMRTLVGNRPHPFAVGAVKIAIGHHVRPRYKPWPCCTPRGHRAFRRFAHTRPPSLHGVRDTCLPVRTCPRRSSSTYRTRRLRLFRSVRRSSTHLPDMSHPRHRSPRRHRSWLLAG